MNKLCIVFLLVLCFLPQVVWAHNFLASTTVNVTELSAVLPMADNSTEQGDLSNSTSPKTASGTDFGAVPNASAANGTDFGAVPNATAAPSAANGTDSDAVSNATVPSAANGTDFGAVSNATSAGNGMKRRAFFNATSSTRNGTELGGLPSTTTPTSSTRTVSTTLSTLCFTCGSYTAGLNTLILLLPVALAAVSLHG